jgi:hypothetical protein
LPVVTSASANRSADSRMTTGRVYEHRHDETAAALLFQGAEHARRPDQLGFVTSALETRQVYSPNSTRNTAVSTKLMDFLNGSTNEYSVANPRNRISTR